MSAQNRFGGAVSQEQLGYSSHDSYKTLISHIAEQLQADDLRSIFWYIDAPPKLRLGSALDVLEYLERAGRFSEKNVVQLSNLLKEIKRVDLSSKVDSYRLQFVRHYSLPAKPVCPVTQSPTQSHRSYSVGAPPLAFPRQETSGVGGVGGGREASLEDVYPCTTPAGHMSSTGPGTPVSGMSAGSDILLPGTPGGHMQSALAASGSGILPSDTLSAMSAGDIFHPGSTSTPGGSGMFPPPGGMAAARHTHSGSAVSDIYPMAHVQKPTNPVSNQSVSQEDFQMWGDGHHNTTGTHVFPSAEPWQPIRSRSLSNSGSIHFNYNSYPSSRDASQEAFQSQPIPIAANEMSHFGEQPVYFPTAGMQMPAEYYNTSRSIVNPPRLYQNWYQQSSLGNILQENPVHIPGHTTFDSRVIPNHSRHTSMDVLLHPTNQFDPRVNPKHSRHMSIDVLSHPSNQFDPRFDHPKRSYNSAVDILPPSHHSSQDARFSTHHRHSQPQMLNQHYYTPPAPRSRVSRDRSSSMDRSRHEGEESHQDKYSPPDHRQLPPNHRQLPPDQRQLPPNQQQLPPDHRQMQQFPPLDYNSVSAVREQSLRAISQELLEMMVGEERVNEEESKLTLKRKAATENGSRSQQPQARAQANNLNSEECPPSSYAQSKTTAKELATLEEVMVNNTEDGVETIRRRRADSLHQDSDRNTRALKAANRYSLVAMGDKDSRREFQSNMMHRSVSASNANGGSSNLIEKTTNGSKGSAMHSTSTLSSGGGEMNHTSPTSTITSSKCKAYNNNSSSLKTHKQKENFLSRLTMPFLKVARPHKEIEWKIKRSKLSKIIYEQTGKFLTCPYKLELDGGFGACNPRLTLYIHPYGREDDTNLNVTLEVGIEISTRPKAQRLDSRAEVEVNVRAEDREKTVVFGQRVVRESARLNYFYIKSFFGHQDLKKSHSEHILVIFSANLISVV